MRQEGPESKELVSLVGGHPELVRRMATSDGDAEYGSDDRPGWLSGTAASEGGGNLDEATSLAGQQSTSDSLDEGEFWLEPLQQWAGIASHVFALAAAAVVFTWATELGGVSWKQGEAKIVFNWHPVCMIIAFLFMTISALSFRMKWRAKNRFVTKMLHIIEWSIAGLCMAVGLVAVVKSHNDPVSGYIANLYSLHSWIGIAVLILYALQFFVGVFSFGFDSKKLGPAKKSQDNATAQIHGTIYLHFYGCNHSPGYSREGGFHWLSLRSHKTRFVSTCPPK
uniref:Cytochrome b561 domain-containing protein n=1 Tax=Odontella aurita TaxID=265563 RepID=A0A7S4JS28_9STRA|mmetsp:Transcript_52356/g.157137  ORF Transcript_52356/g.157137 Transcript_52356/m.157137 type:complete len:281 (+) Transcript_52356:71-913(+)